MEAQSQNSYTLLYQRSAQSLQLSDGEAIAGTILDESPDRLVIAQLDGSARQVQKADIKNRSAQNASAMPPMAGILTKREIRNLIAFLASL